MSADASASSAPPGAAAARKRLCSEAPAGDDAKFNQDDLLALFADSNASTAKLVSDSAASTLQKVSEENKTMFTHFETQQNDTLAIFAASMEAKVEKRVQTLDEIFDLQEERFASMEKLLADDRAQLKSLSSQLDDARKDTGVLQSPSPAPAFDPDYKRAEGPTILRIHCPKLVPRDLVQDVVAPLCSCPDWPYQS